LSCHLTDTKPRNLESTLYGDSASSDYEIADVDYRPVLVYVREPLNPLWRKLFMKMRNRTYGYWRILDDSGATHVTNNIVIATDADVDGMHIRLILLIFFCQFFPELDKKALFFKNTFRVQPRRNLLLLFWRTIRKSSYWRTETKTGNYPI
jgi:topoisomerase-4 subunit B